MDPVLIHLGVWSLAPAVVALVLAIFSKRVIESLLLGILVGVVMVDANLNGMAHSLIYSIPNLFSAVVGHNPDPAKGWMRGMGLINGTGRAEVMLVVILLGSFVTILERSGGAFAFGNLLTKKIKGRRGAQLATATMGSVLFTSAYFSSLATGTVFKPVFDRMKISRAKLSFLLDATSAPINTLIPISGWVAYMSQLMVDNIPGVNDGIVGLVKTIPYNFYCWFILIFVFLNAAGIIKDFGPMKKAEEQILEKTDFDEDVVTKPKSSDGREIKDGKASDMMWPLGVSVVALVMLGLWNYTFSNFFGTPQVPLNGNQMLIVSFVLGLIVAFFKYVGSGLMSFKEFLDDALEGTKSAIIGGMIILLAVTLGDLLRAASPEGVGAAQFLEQVAGDLIPAAIVPMAVFILSSFMGFAMGTSWGVWAIMIPIAVPLTLATGGSPIVAAAAVLSGGTFGDHCSPISDTTIMSSIGAGCDHMTHVNTQLVYACTVAVLSALAYLVVGFIV